MRFIQTGFRLAVTTFVLASGVAFAQETLKAPGDWVNHPNVCNLLLTAYSDDYTPGEELEDFWAHHPRFGILNKDGRHYLVTRDEAMSSKIRADLEAYRNTLGLPKSSATPVPLEQIPGSVVYDVTNILTPEMRYLNGRFTTEGNCWNFACYSTGIASGIFHMIDDEFSFWLESPLARKLSDQEKPQPGDLIAFRIKGKTKAVELHGLVYVSDDLVLAKSEAAEGRFHIQDSQEQLYLYGTRMVKMAEIGMLGKSRTPPVIYTEAYRMMSLSDYVQAHRSELSKEVIGALDHLAETEKTSTFHSVEPDGEMDDDFQVKWREAGHSLFSMRKDLKSRLERATSLMESRSASEQFLWKAIGVRLSSLGKL